MRVRVPPFQDSLAADAGGLGCLGERGSLFGDLAEDDAAAPGESGEGGGEVVDGRIVGSGVKKVCGVLAKCAHTRSPLPTHLKSVLSS